MVYAGDDLARSAVMRVNRELAFGRPLILALMSVGQGDVLWEAFVVAMLAMGPAVERRSRYGDKPALCTASREIAHLEAPGVIDLRITRAGWVRVRDSFNADLAVDSPADLDRLDGLLAAAMAAST